MRINKYEPAMYYLLRAKQIQLTKDSIASREKLIRSLTKKKKQSKGAVISA